MNISPADYDTLAARDERLAILFGRRYGYTKPLGSLIDSMTFTNADQEGVGLARAIIRQADRFPESFDRILDAYDRRMEGALPRAVLISEARAAGWEDNPIAFLYGISANLYETCDLNGPHALLVGTLVGDIERHVVDTIVAADGTRPRLSFIAPAIQPDTSEAYAREMFCSHFVGAGDAYFLLRAGVEAGDLVSGAVPRDLLVLAVHQGVGAAYAVAALKSGIESIDAIAYGYKNGIPLEYLGEAAA